MLERSQGDLEGLDSETKRVKLEEQVTTVAIPQPKVMQCVHFEIFAILKAQLNRFYHTTAFTS